MTNRHTLVASTLHGRVLRHSGCAYHRYNVDACTRPRLLLRISRVVPISGNNVAARSGLRALY